MPKVQIDKIIINERKRSSKDIKELSESIKKIGLLNPITLNKDMILIAGFHRLQACKELGLKEIAVNIIDVDSLTAELVEIDENLIRTELTALENAEQLKRRKEIYEFLHPECKPENIKAQNLSKRKDFVSEKPKTFVEDTAKKTGKSSRSVQQDIQIANKISEEVKLEIKGTELENKKSILLAIAKQPAEKQKEFVKNIVCGQSVKEIDTKEEEIHISVEVYEKVKFALDEAEYELDLVKKENQELKAKINELENLLNKDNMEVVKNALIEDFEKIDYINRKILVDNEWLELPLDYDMTDKKYEQMYWIANNYNVNKQKES